MAQPLVVRLCNYIGDVVLSIPALNLLQSHGFDLHLYGKGWAGTLLSGYSWPLTVRASKLGQRLEQLRQLNNTLRRGQEKRPSVEALIMPNSFSSAFEMRLAGLRTAGLPRDSRALLLSRRLTRCDEPHALQGFWHLACQLTGYEGSPPAHIGLKITDASAQAADALIRSRGLSSGFLCVAPFCAGLVDGHSKQWPEFPDLVQQLSPLGWPIVVCPGPGEEAKARTSFPSAQIFEGIALDTYAALMARARLVIANDTGPAHIAAAVGARVISVLGPTQVSQWAPWGLQVEVLSERPQFPSLNRVRQAVISKLN